MKKYLFIFVVLALVLVSCGGATPEPCPACPEPVAEPCPEVECPECPEAECPTCPEVTCPECPEVEGEPLLWFSIFNAKHPVVALMRFGFILACEEYNFNCDEVLVMDPDPDAYVSAMEQVAQLGGDAAVIYNDSDALVGGALLLEESMPTVSFHKPFPLGESPNTAWVSADTEAYAIDAAERIAEKIGGEGVVATSMSNPGGVEDVVIAAFTETMEKYPGIEVLPPVHETTEFNVATGLAGAQLIAHPEIVAVFTSTGAGAAAWATAARDTGFAPGQIVIVGMDYTEQNLDLIANGEVWGIVGQPLVEEVYEATVIAYHIAKGWPYEEQNWLPAPFVTAEDVDKYMEYIRRSQE